MQRKRGELVPIGEVVADLDGPVQAIRDASPQALHHFTRFDQVNQLVSASEAEPEVGFMARMMALCSLPRSNPGNRKEYKRVNGPLTLIMLSSSKTKLPYGNLPCLILAWVCTEAVRTRSRDLVLGKSLSEFMRKLGMAPLGGGSRGERTRLRNQEPQGAGDGEAPGAGRVSPGRATARARDRKPGGPGERPGGGAEPEQAETFEVGRGVRAGAGGVSGARRGSGTMRGGGKGNGFRIESRAPDTSGTVFSR